MVNREYRETGFQTFQREFIVAAQYRNGRGPILGWRAYVRDEKQGYSPQHGGQTLTVSYPVLREYDGTPVEAQSFFDLKRRLGELPFVKAI